MEAKTITNKGILSAFSFYMHGEVKTVPRELAATWYPTEAMMQQWYILHKLYSLSNGLDGIYHDFSDRQEKQCFLLFTDDLTVSGMAPKQAVAEERMDARAEYLCHNGMVLMRQNHTSFALGFAGKKALEQPLLKECRPLFGNALTKLAEWCGKFHQHGYLPALDDMGHTLGTFAEQVKGTSFVSVATCLDMVMYVYRNMSDAGLDLGEINTWCWHQGYRDFAADFDWITKQVSRCLCDMGYIEKL